MLKMLTKHFQSNPCTSNFLGPCLNINTIVTHVSSKDLFMKESMLVYFQ